MRDDLDHVSLVLVDVPKLAVMPCHKVLLVSLDDGDGGDEPGR